jgi:hypothetical protein
MTTRLHRAHAPKATKSDTAQALAKMTRQMGGLLGEHMDHAHALRTARAIAIIWQTALGIIPQTPDYDPHDQA